MNSTTHQNHRCRTSPGAIITTAVIAGFLGFMIGNGVGRHRPSPAYDGTVSPAPASAPADRDVNTAPGASGQTTPATQQ